MTTEALPISSYVELLVGVPQIAPWFGEGEVVEGFCICQAWSA